MRLTKLLSVFLVLAVMSLLIPVCGAWSENAVSQDIYALADSEEVVVEKSALNEAVSEMGAEDITHLNILLSNGTISIGLPALVALLEESGDEITFSIKEVNQASLNAEQALATDGRPVYDVRIFGTEDIIDFGGAAITVTLPYDMPLSESASELCIWHLNELGKQETLPGSYEDGFISFETTSLSYFAIGYESGAASDKALQYLLITALMVVMAAILTVYFMRKKQIP